MFKNLSSLWQRTPGAPKKAALNGRQKMLLISVLGVAALCYLVTNPSQEMGEIAYRMTWLVLTGVVLSILYAVHHNKQELNVMRCLLIVILVIAQTFLNYGLFFLRSLSNQYPDVIPNGISYGQLLLVLPYGLAPSIIAAMLGRRLGVFVALSTALFGLAIMPLECQTVIIEDYLVISLLAGLLSAMLCGHVRKRESIVHAGVVTGLVVFISAIALDCGLKNNELVSIKESFHLGSLALEGLAALLSSFIVAVFVCGLMPLLEKYFNISTHITWLEWADMNHPVLKKLQMTAPGTFHHSLYVQRLAEAAAEAIGADVTRAGVCGLYHDIGKLRNPQYFSENIPNQDNSPHKELTPEASARIIIQHVQDGVEIAREYKLNTRIINAIREHHGISTAYFFYRKALDNYAEAKAKYDEGLADTCPEEVNKAIFTYKGPVPQTRESGIVSMADAVESATRSLVNPSEQDIQDMIEGIFKGRILDGHLQDCQITLGDIAKMKQAFFNTLRTMNHNRIAYPKPKEEGEALLERERHKAGEAAQDKASS